MTKALHIDIVSDVVCPWCAIGYHQLRHALDELGMEAAIHWQPFQLNPDMGTEGQNLGEHLGEKYGITPQQSRQNRAHITAIGADLGFTFNFTDEMRMVNTHDAHQLIHWAGLVGRDSEVKEAFQKAYFTDGLDVSDRSVLIALVADLGFDAEEARAILQEQRYDGAVRKQMDFWRQQGINSVPAIIFERKYLVSGAAGIEHFRKVLSDIAAEQG
ncbi:DsbA family oxidoreductase [uncultured Cohaesibacter sp.]|uniref:DsbA family oxidoreductase n=1 Tax=uncultured Cohaesibacter sp. TaxID=1002546 RepID=UPI0029C77DA6|nr:DsbA family oxidoreductase [uncultured Cohaesibacter sp.]